MLDEKDLQAIAQMISASESRMMATIAAQGKILEEHSKALARIQDDLAELKEAHEETRAGVNSLLAWADSVSVARDFPLPKI